MTEITQSAIGPLIMLLQTALGEVLEVHPQSIDLKSVYELSQKQEVTAVALEGLQKLTDIYPDLLQVDISTKAIKMQWIGNMMRQEKRYNANLLAAKELATLYDRNEIQTYVLKGFTISQLYPIPSHRFSCDLDCFLLSKQDCTNVYEFGNSLVESMGCKVDASYYKHSVFAYQGLTIENHHYCCSIKRSKRTRDLETYLSSLLKGYVPRYIPDTKLAIPSQMFQALFMIEHANGHFLYSKMSLKHVCDWAMMRNAFMETLDWQEFDKQCTRFGLRNFVECMNHLADYVLGKSNYNELRSIDKRVLEDTFKEVHLSPNLMRQRMEKAIGVLRSSWKFKHFCGDSMIKELTHSVWAYLSEDEPELD